ncbi:hypothetical protein D3C76_1497600 [compost metagenome]
MPHGTAVWCRPTANPRFSIGHHSATAVTSMASPAPLNTLFKAWNTKKAAKVVVNIEIPVNSVNKV